ncbi:MAG: hypothetical protein ACD_29C00424G0002 [uncultured bacterium]|nr:MAG: hypothetical protein ACD_29C00424G0002 [uncultured bacterium]
MERLCLSKRILGGRVSLVLGAWLSYRQMLCMDIYFIEFTRKIH